MAREKVEWKMDYGIPCPRMREKVKFNETTQTLTTERFLSFTTNVQRSSYTWWDCQLCWVCVRWQSLHFKRSKRVRSYFLTYWDPFKVLFLQNWYFFKSSLPNIICFIVLSLVFCIHPVKDDWNAYKSATRSCTGNSVRKLTPHRFLEHKRQWSSIILLFAEM